MATKPDQRLTRRQIHNERHRIALSLTQINNRLVQAANGQLELTSSQLGAAKLLLSKTMPDVSSEDLDTSIEAERTVTEIAQGAIDMLSSPKVIATMIACNRKASEQIRDNLITSLASTSIESVKVA